MSVTNHNNSGRGLPGPILGIKNLRPGGGWGWGVKISKVREISRTAEKIDKKKSAEKITETCNPHPTPSDGGGVRGENFKVTKLQGLKSISGMQLS